MRLASCIPVVFASLLAAATAAEPPKETFPKKLDGDGVENVYQLADGLYSGSKPKTEEAFRYLRKLGVKTILSVDGADPKTEMAGRYGIAYVHVPIGHDAIPADKVARIVGAGRPAAGPLYVHCHFGMNRGPSAAALIALARHGWTHEQAAAWLKTAGTAPECEGLHRTVRGFKSQENAAGEPSSTPR